MKLQKIPTYTIFTFLVIPLVSGQVVIDDGVVLEQPDNDVEINFSNSMNFSDVYVSASDTSLDGSNFTVTPTGSTDTEVLLYLYKNSVGVGEKAFDFNVTSSASSIQFSFSELSRNYYEIRANNDLYDEIQTTPPGILSFSYSDWSKNAFDIFRSDSLADNVSVTLTGEYGDVVADGQDIMTGVVSDADYPYVVMHNSTNVEGIMAYSGFEQLKYTQTGGKDVISLRKDFDGGRFILPANTGDFEDIENREQLVTNDRFLSSSRPSFTGAMDGKHTVSVIKDYNDINITGDFVIDPGTASSISVESLSSSSFQDVISGGNKSVSLTGQ